MLIIYVDFQIQRVSYTDEEYITTTLLCTTKMIII